MNQGSEFRVRGSARLVFAGGIAFLAIASLIFAAFCPICEATLPQTGVEILQNAAAATGNGTEFVVAGRSNAVFQVSGTFVATVTWEATVNGTDWIGVAIADLNSTTRARALTSTTTGLFLLDEIGGLQRIRARISAYTSGSVTVKGSASDD